MRRFAFALGGLLFVVAACNALSGVGDLAVCDGVECNDTSGKPTEAGLSDRTVGNEGDETTGRGEAGSSESSDGCAGCAQACVNGVCALYASCRAGALKCGATNESCCESRPVPGGTFNRLNYNDESATISAYRLDTYEVTVGRFRAFVEAGMGVATSPPAAGVGAHPKVANSGWKTTWNSQLSNTTELFEGVLQDGTFSKTPSSKTESLPMTNVSWFEAFAFCAWDGGRLPTIAEYSFAAVGGTEQRVYPWSSPPSSDFIDPSKAVYDCRYAPPGLVCPGPLCVGATPAQAGACNAATCVDAGGSCQDPGCTGCDREVDLPPVGSLPAGAGKYGHLDLAGSVGEMVFDGRTGGGDVDLPNPCNDCALVMGDQPKGSGGAPDQHFLVVNGDWGDNANSLKAGSFYAFKYDERHEWLGFRCARDP